MTHNHEYASSLGDGDFDSSVWDNILEMGAPTGRPSDGLAVPRSKMSLNSGTSTAAVPKSESPSGFTKPPYSYRALVTQALNSAGSHGLTLREIYDWFETNFEYFRDVSHTDTAASWRSSVRHNLVSHPEFVRRAPAISPEDTGVSNKFSSKAAKPGRNLSWSRTARWVLSSEAQLTDQNATASSQVSRKKSLKSISSRKSSTSSLCSLSSEAPNSSVPTSPISSTPSWGRFPIIGTGMPLVAPTVSALHHGPPVSMQSEGTVSASADTRPVFARGPYYSLSSTPPLSCSDDVPVSDFSLYNHDATIDYMLSSSIPRAAQQLPLWVHTQRQPSSSFLTPTMESVSLDVLQDGHAEYSRPATPDHLRALTMWLLDTSSHDLAPPMY